MAAPARHSSVYLVSEPGIGAWGRLEDSRLSSFTERHKFQLDHAPQFQAYAGVDDALAKNADADGVIITLEGGIPPLSILRMSRRILGLGRRVFFYWPFERAVELVDRIR